MKDLASDKRATSFPATETADLARLTPAPTPATTVALALKEVRDLSAELGKIGTKDLWKADKVISLLHKVDPQIFAALPNEANAIYKWCFEAIVREGQTRTFGDRAGQADMTAVMGLQLAANILKVCNRSVEVSGLGEIRGEALKLANAEVTDSPVSPGGKVKNLDGLVVRENPEGVRKSSRPQVSPSVVDVAADWAPDHIGMISTMLQQQGGTPIILDAGIELVKGLSPVDFHRLATSTASIGASSRLQRESTVHVIDKVIDLCDDKLGANSMHAEGTKAFLLVALATYAHDSNPRPSEVAVAAREILSRRGLAVELNNATVGTALSYVGVQEYQTIMGGTHHVFYTNPVVAYYYTERQAIYERVSPPFAN